MRRYSLNPKQKQDVKNLIREVKEKTLRETKEPEELAQCVAELSAFIALNKRYGQFQKFRGLIYADL